MAPIMIAHIAQTKIASRNVQAVVVGIIARANGASMFKVDQITKAQAQTVITKIVRRGARYR